MGREGMTSLTRLLGGRETSVTNYRDPSLDDLYVEYDHRIDRRPAARAVLVRTAMPQLPTSVEALVARYGVPDDGAADLADGLHDGVAVWVDERCGVVLTAYRPPASWWAAEGGATLQLETLDRALKGGSPGSSKVSAVLERKRGSGNGMPEASPSAAVAPAETSDSPPETLLAMNAETPSPEVEPPADSVDTADSPPETLPPADNGLDQAPLPATEVPAAAEMPMTVPPPAAEPPSPAAQPPSAPPPSPRQPEVRPEVRTVPPAAPAAPQTLAAWRAQVTVDPAQTTGPKSSAPPAPHTIATWRGGAPTTAQRPNTQNAPHTIATWHPEVRAEPTPRAEATTLDRRAARISYVPPVYPPAARLLKKGGGHVTLAILVKPDGTVGTEPRVVAVRPAGRGFAESAIEAVQKWRFSPAIQRGRPVESYITVDVEFE